VTSITSTTAGSSLDRTAGKARVHGLNVEGGMDIETVAHDSPEKIIKAYISIQRLGSLPLIGRKLGYALGLKGETSQ
jgi:succinyl-CoA synthetase beta subunit